MWKRDRDREREREREREKGERYIIVRGLLVMLCFLIKNGGLCERERERVCEREKEGGEREKEKGEREREKREEGREINPSYWRLFMFCFFN